MVPLRPPGSALGLPQDREDADEDVHEVHEHVHRDIDGVVERAIQPLGHVEFVDHDGTEQEEHHPVQDTEDQLHVDAECRQDDAAELDEDRAKQQAEQRGSPCRQILRQQCADGAGGQHHDSGQGERLGYAGCSEQCHERAYHDTHGDGTYAATDQGHPGAVVCVRQRATTDGREHTHQQEADVQPGVGERPAVAERGAQHGDNDEHGGEAGDRHHEATWAHGVNTSLVLVVKGIGHQRAFRLRCEATDVALLYLL